MPSHQTLLQKIAALPTERQGEVEDFVDFLSAKFQRAAALDRLLSIAPAMEAAGILAMTEHQVQAEVDAVRLRPERGTVADSP